MQKQSRSDALIVVDADRVRAVVGCRWLVYEGWDHAVQVGIKGQDVREVPREFDGGAELVIYLGAPVGGVLIVRIGGD